MGPGPGVDAPTGTAPSSGAYPTDLERLIEQYLQGVIADGPGGADGLGSAMRYSLLAGGKRIRPVLSLATHRALGGDPERMLPLAAAIEMIHTYSLIHDDLPAMDDDELRRGRPTLHVARGEATAILAGDALYAEAFRLLLSSSAMADSAALASAAASLAEATGLEGMVGGQFLDVEGLAPPGPDGLQLMHRLKTGALIRASVVCVLLLAEGLDPAVASGAERYATELGMLFQIVDDILDVTGSEASLGKPHGSDQRQGKRTYVTEYGMEGARELADEAHRRAIGSLEVLGSRAGELKAIADHVATRSK